MGNCCKKRINNLVDKISLESQSKRESKKSNKSTDKNPKEKYENYTMLILGQNKRNKNPESHERPLLLRKKNDYIINKAKEKLESIDEKVLKNYEVILLNYIKFRKEIEFKCEKEKIYVVKKSDNEDLISLYNEIINNENNDEVDEKQLIKEKLINFITNKQKIKVKFKVMNFNMCEEIIKTEDNKIDLLNENLCKKLELQKMKDNEVTYINNEPNGEFRYLLFKNKKKIKINIISKIFSLIEIVDDNVLNYKYNFGASRNKKGKQKNNISSKKTNINGNELIINVNEENLNNINLDINSDKNKNNHNNLISKENEEKIEVKSNKEEKGKGENTYVKNERKTDIKSKEEKKNEKSIDEPINEKGEEIIDKYNDEKNIEDDFDGKNEKSKYSIIIDEDNKEEKNENESALIIIAFEILILYKIQKNQLKNKNTYYLCKKNIISKIIQEISNNHKEKQDINKLINEFLEKQTDTSDIKTTFQQFKKENINLFENKYDFNIINKADLYLNKKDIINICNENLELYNDFIVVTNEIYELLIKLFSIEKTQDINNIFQKIEILKYDEKEKFVVLHKFEENIIYFCKSKEQDGNSIFNIYKLLFYNSNEIYLKESILLEKNNFDINIYLQEKNIDINNYNQKIFDEKGMDIGFFINLKQPKEKDEKKIEEENEEIIPKKPIGLVSLNSTSYLNSLLQCFYHIPELTNYFISNKTFLNLTEEQLTKEESFILNDIELNKDSLSFNYIETLYHLYHKKSNNKYIKYYPPKNLLEYILNQGENKFMKNKENNPKALCIYFMEQLKQELNPKENIKSLELENNSNLFNSMVQNEEEILYQKYLNDFKFNNNSIIDKIFTGIKLISITCEKCNESENSFKVFYYLRFSLEKTGKNMENKFKKIDLNECFKYYTSNQKATQLCQQCGNNSNVCINNKFCLCPKILIIFLEDIKDKGNLFKIEMELSINEYTKDKNEEYKLIGMIIFFKQGGFDLKYQAYCYSNEYNKWYCFFDEYIYEVEDIIKDIEEKNKYPYLLFYQDISLFN